MKSLKSIVGSDTSYSAQLATPQTHLKQDHQEMQATRRNIEIAIKGKWITVPALEVNGKNIVVGGKWIRIARVEAEEWLESELEDPQRCVQVLKQQRSADLQADILSFAQKPPDIHRKYQFPVEWDSVAAVCLTSFQEWWDGLPQETRKNVRRAQKRGVVVQVRTLDDALIRDLQILNNDSPVRQGKVFTHYGKTIDQVKKDQAAFLDRCDYICAYHEKELIGVVKLIYRGEVASILTFLPKASHHDKRPANAIMAKAVELCEQKGIHYLTFGKFNYGNKHHTPLREFKIRNGFGEIRVPHYYVPLTVKGAISVRLKLHRGLLGLLPHGVITFLVNTRAKLHAFKQQPV
jgi:hypothetical protein